MANFVITCILFFGILYVQSC